MDLGGAAVRLVLALSALALAVFIRRQWRTPFPLMRLGLFGHRQFAFGGVDLQLQCGARDRSDPSYAMRLKD